MRKLSTTKLSIKNRIQSMLFESISHTNSLTYTNNQLIQCSLIFSFFQLVGFILNQINNDDACLNDNTNRNTNNQSINIFQMISYILQIIYTPIFFDDIKILYFIITYMVVQLIILIIAIFTKCHAIHHILSFFVIYHGHIFAFFIHNACVKYIINNKLSTIILTNYSNTSNYSSEYYALLVILTITIIILDILNLLLCFYFDIFYYNNNYKQYILAKYSNITNVIYHFSRIIIVIIVYIPYLDQYTRILFNSISMMVICAFQVYLLIKYNIYIIWKIIKLYTICYTSIFLISLIVLLSCLFEYNLYRFIPILVIVPLVCKIIIGYMLRLYLYRLYKDLEIFQNEWECLAHYYSFQNLYSHIIYKDDLSIDNTSRKIILNGLMIKYYKLFNDTNWGYNNNAELNITINHITHDQDCLSEFSRKLLESYIKKFPNSILLKLHLIQNLSIGFKLCHKSLLMIESISNNCKGLNLTQKFTIFESKKLIENMIKNGLYVSKNNDIEIINLIRYLDFMKEFHKLFNEQISNSIIFWKELLKTEVELISIYNNAQKIFEFNKKMETIWLRIDSICQQKVGIPYLLYGLYNYIIMNSRDLGQKMIEIYRKILYMNIILETKIIEGIYDSSHDNNLFSKDNMYFIISGEKHDLGMVIDCSDNTMSILGYEKNEIIRQNIEIIIPPIYRKDHQIYMIKYINNIYKKLFDHSLNMYFVSKNKDLYNCVLNIKDSYHEIYGMIFFVLIRPINLNYEYILMYNNGIIDCMTKKIREEIGFESTIPKNTHIDSVIINLVSIQEFSNKKGIKNENILDNPKFLNGDIIQLISEYQDNNDIYIYYLCYTEQQIIREELTIHKTILKKIFNEDLNISLLIKYKEDKLKTSLLKLDTQEFSNEIPDEPSRQYNLSKIYDTKLGKYSLPKKFIPRETKTIEKDKFSMPYMKLGSDRSTFGNMYSESLIVNNGNALDFNQCSTQEHFLKNSNPNILTRNRKELKFNPTVMITGIDICSQSNITSLKNTTPEADLNKVYSIQEIDKIPKKPKKNSKLETQNTMMTVIAHDSRITLEDDSKQSRPKIFEDKQKFINKRELPKPLKKKYKKNNFESSQDISSSTHEYQNFIQRALKVGYILKEVHLMKGFIYLFLVLHIIIIALYIYYEINSVDASKASITALQKSYDRIDNLLDIRYYARLLYVIDSNLIAIDRHTDMNISDFHNFCLVKLNEKRILLNDANSDFSEFLYANIEPKYRDQITMTEIQVHWDLEDNNTTTHGTSFSEQYYSIITVMNLIIHQTYVLVYSDLPKYDLDNLQLNFLLNNAGGAILEQDSKSSDIFEEALLNYLQIYLNIQIALFCLGWILILISCTIFSYIIYKLFTEKIKILKIFTLIRPEEIKIVLERFNHADNWFKMKDHTIKNMDKSLDQLFTIESIKDNSIIQRKRIKANIISKKIRRSYTSIIIKLSMLIATLGIFYAANICSFINFEKKNKILAQKLEFINDHLHTIALSLSLAYQFLQRNATGNAYHDYPNSGNITTVLSFQLQKERDLMNLLDEISGVNLEIDYSLSENICYVNPNISLTDCLNIANGALDLGLVGVSTYIYKSLYNIYDGFLNSNRSLLAIKEMLNDPNLKDIEILTSFYFDPLYDNLSDILNQSFENQAQYMINYIKIIASIFIIWLVIIIIFGLLPVQKKLEIENKGLKKLLRLIPYFIYSSNKYLEQNLLKMTPGINFKRRT